MLWLHSNWIIALDFERQKVDTKYIDGLFVVLKTCCLTGNMIAPIKSVWKVLQTITYEILISQIWYEEYITCDIVQPKTTLVAFRFKIHI